MKLARATCKISVVQWFAGNHTLWWKLPDRATILNEKQISGPKGPLKRDVTAGSWVSAVFSKNRAPAYTLSIILVMWLFRKCLDFQIHRWLTMNHKIIIIWCVKSIENLILFFKYLKYTFLRQRLQAMSGNTLQVSEKIMV